jgi:hypothetical protein
LEYLYLSPFIKIRCSNYFGDVTQSLAYFHIDCSADGWWTIFSPLIITLLLLRVSVVARLEQILREIRSSYQEYIESTFSFIPWFPPKKDSDLLAVPIRCWNPTHFSIQDTLPPLLISINLPLCPWCPLFSSFLPFKTVSRLPV